MAKKLNILKTGGTVPFADGGLKLSKSIKISEIESHPDFESLFKIDGDLLERIVSSITENGFDASQPVHIWAKTEDDGSQHNYLIDGYTRLAAVKQAGHETVPYFEHHFESFDEAYKYVLGLQVNRRNLESSELLRNVAKLMGTDFVQNAEGKKSELIAETLGVSPRTAEKAISVIKDADEETLEQIDSGELTVNQAYNKKHPKKATERNVAADEGNPDEADSDSPDDFDAVSDALEDTSGNPGEIHVHSRDMSEQFNPPEESDIDRRMIERYKGGFVAGFEKGFSEAAYQLYDRMLSMLKDGKSAGYIKTDDVFSDFTFSVIAPKLKIPSDSEGILREFNK